MKKFLYLAALISGAIFYTNLNAQQNPPAVSGCGSNEDGYGNWGRCYSGVCKASINPWKTCSGTTVVDEPIPDPVP